MPHTGPFEVRGPPRVPSRPACTCGLVRGEAADGVVQRHLRRGTRGGGRGAAGRCAARPRRHRTSAAWMFGVWFKLPMKRIPCALVHRDRGQAPAPRRRDRADRQSRPRGSRRAGASPCRRRSGRGRRWRRRSALRRAASRNRRRTARRSGPVVSDEPPRVTQEVQVDRVDDDAVAGESRRNTGPTSSATGQKVESARSNRDSRISSSTGSSGSWKTGHAQLPKVAHIARVASVGHVRTR